MNFTIVFLIIRKILDRESISIPVRRFHQVTKRSDPVAKYELMKYAAFAPWKVPQFFCISISHIPTWF